MTTQQTIDDANNKLATAQAVYNSALQNEAIEKGHVIDWYNLVSQCNVGFVSSTLYVKADRNSCGHKNSGHCQATSTCKSNVDTYNSYIDAWNTRIQERINAKTALDAAIAYKDSVIKNAQNDPTFIAQQQQNQNAALLAQKKLDEEKARTRNIAIAVTIIVVVIIAGILIWKKLK